MKKFSFNLNLADATADDLGQADLRFTGVDDTGPSYEGRVFLNNANADKATPKDSAHGYAGSFFVFGHSGCLGDEGHCQWEPGVREFDKRPTHINKSIETVVSIKDALLALLEQGERNIEVTVVPVVRKKPGDSQKLTRSMSESLVSEEVDRLNLSSSQPTDSMLLIRKKGQTSIKDAIEIKSNSQ